MLGLLKQLFVLLFGFLCIIVGCGITETLFEEELLVLFTGGIIGFSLMLLGFRFFDLLDNSIWKHKNKTNKTSTKKAQPVNYTSNKISFASEFERIDWTNTTIEEISRLIKRGADINERFTYRKTLEDGTLTWKLLVCPLDVVEQPEIATYLISQGAIVNPENGPSPLHNASNAAIAEILIKAGADINKKDGNGETPLIYALNYPIKKVDVAEYLVNMGADVNAKDKKTGKTPICYMVSAEFTENLIKHGANIYVVTNDKETPLTLAVEEDKIPIVKTLIKHGADVNDLSCGITALHNTKSLKMTKLLLDSGASSSIPSTKIRNSVYPLHMIAMRDYDSTELLLKSGANPNVKNINGDTPLHFVRDASIAELLIKYGANVNEQNNNGETPLHSVLQDEDFETFEDEYAETANTLLENGADREIEDNKGKKPFDYLENKK